MRYRVVCPLCHGKLEVVVSIHGLDGAMLPWAEGLDQGFMSLKGYQAVACDTCGLLTFDLSTFRWSSSRASGPGVYRQALSWER